MNHYFSILGAGKFGRALASVIARSDKQEQIQIRFYDPKAQEGSTTNLAYACFAGTAIAGKHWVITSMPAAQVMPTVQNMALLHKGATDSDHPCSIVLVSKGSTADGEFVPAAMERAGLVKSFHMSAIASQQPMRYSLAAIAGPHFAQGLVDAEFTITSIACSEEDELLLKDIFAEINPSFTRDVLALQILSVMKNFAAYACGVAHGLALAENTKASLFAKCMESTLSLLQSYNCPTDVPPAILADWVLCCTSATSRNFAAGLADSTDNNNSIAENCNQQQQLTESLKSVDAMHRKQPENHLIRLVHDYSKTRDTALIQSFLHTKSK